MTAKLTWLGKSGFILTGDGTTLAVDPFISPHELRLTAPPPLGALPIHVDAVLATHGHADHLDLAGLAAWHESGATLSCLIVPAPHVAAARRALPDVDVVGVQPADRLKVASAEVTVVPAGHGISAADGYTDGYRLDPKGTPHVGYVVAIAGTTVYHAGDTIASTGLRRALAPFTIDVALLPVNGRDPAREQNGIVGNLNAVEAVERAEELKANCLVPCHQDTIRGNTAPVDDVVRAARRRSAAVHILLPDRGRRATALDPYRRP